MIEFEQERAIEELIKEESETPTYLITLIMVLIKNNKADIVTNSVSLYAVPIMTMVIFLLLNGLFSTSLLREHQF